ncbi:hypothetical protein [Nocardioides daeguensis]|uniref:Uncharacterized protein n=1 Tax=Nocardioides daeguensis TaxID=908359 RepID=A0ABP6V5W3_9ACTN|nr:hypothetical protein [Nocardioides daeguensis]MBV6726351.1 hypothetical protein [Nocardioides daeguensis]MCR1772194.1 hypothetical protein [Nocardioides daeguensis]
MAKKQKAWIHVGVPGAGDVVESALVHHRAALVELGVASLAHSTAESFRAAVEITRSHKDWGLKRADVEGQWTRLVRRAHKTKSDIVFSQSLLAAATADQVALLVDALAGYQVHVVLTTGLDDVAPAIAQWQAACRKPERLHVIETDGLGPAQVWKACGKVVGFGTASLGLDDLPGASATLQTLPEALREVERLARRNASLEIRLEELDRKRRKLKRRLDSAA